MPSMFKCSLWDVKEPKHYSKRAGPDVPGVVAFLCEYMGAYGEGDMPRMGLSVPFAYHLALRCKSCKNKNKTKKLTDRSPDLNTQLQHC